MLGETAMGLVDTKLVGGLGAAALGGVGMATVLMFLSYSLIFGLARGVKVRVAYAIGEKRPGDAVRYGQAGTLIGAVLGVLVFLAARDVSPVLRLLHVAEDTIPHARDFLAARTFGAMSSCALVALTQYRQGLEDSRTPMLVGIAGNVVNALLAWALIYGRLGLPALGVRGAGYGTAITETLEMAVMLSFLVRESRGNKEMTISISNAAKEVVTLGGPTGLQFAFETLAFTAFSALIASLGAAEIAGNQVAINVLRASFLPGVAIGEAASVLVARSLGERRVGEADRVVRSALRFGVAFMAACGIVFAVAGGAIARTFTDDPEVARIVTRLLLIGSVFQALDAVNIILRGALRGAKDVRWTMFVGIAIVWVCVPGAALVLGHGAGWGAVGGWCGFIAETAISSFVFWRRWKTGEWRKRHGAPLRVDGADMTPLPA